MLTHLHCTAQTHTYRLTWRGRKEPVSSPTTPHRHLHCPSGQNSATSSGFLRSYAGNSRLPLSLLLIEVRTGSHLFPVFNAVSKSIITHWYIVTSHTNKSPALVSNWVSETQHETCWPTYNISIYLSKSLLIGRHKSLVILNFFCFGQNSTQKKKMQPRTYRCMAALTFRLPCLKWLPKINNYLKLT